MDATRIILSPSKPFRFSKDLKTLTRSRPGALVRCARVDRRQERCVGEREI